MASAVVASVASAAARAVEHAVAAAAAVQRAQLQLLANLACASMNVGPVSLEGCPDVDACDLAESLVDQARLSRGSSLPGTWQVHVPRVT